jgi:two-component system, NtrC family, response regulator AtoC
MNKVLIADDDCDLRGIVRDVLQEEGFLTLEAADGRSAVEVFKAEGPDAALVDLKMPDMDGIETMREMKKIDEGVPVIILTGYGDVRRAVEAIKGGAYDFAEKPPDFKKLVITLRRATERRELELQVNRTTAALELSLERQFGKSQAMKQVIAQLKRIAPTDFSVIIQGETGTGKSFVAESIHNLSKRSDKPFVCVDIGLIPDLLVESELFGYKKGAFTGADRDKKGYFETADHGTMFIDELENMSTHVQGKLLSFIERKTIYPLGCTTPIEMHLRLIAATNKDIWTRVKKQEFREDLFYRLGEFILTLPPLRERLEDIPFFAGKFLFEAATEMSKQIREIDDAALVKLKTHPWPGNLRELKNVMRRAVLLAEEDVIRESVIKFPADGLSGDSHSSSCLSLKESVKDLEKKLIRQAMEASAGNKTRAAEMLGISYKNLFDKLKEYDAK